jgi:hypothetical protein
MCSFFVAFFSANIDCRNLIFGHKLHIGMPILWEAFLGPIYAHFSSHFSPQILMAYMFNVYKNQQSRQTGSRNLMGPETLPTIWGTDMKLMTKYQICVINSCWEKCDEKCAYMLNVYKSQLSRQTGSRNLTGHKTLPIYIFFKYVGDIYTLRGGEGILFYLCPSFRLSKIFFVAFSQQLSMAENTM